MKPAILPMIITLSLSACSNLNPSAAYLRNPAVDAKYSFTYASAAKAKPTASASATPDAVGNADEDKLDTSTNLQHAGYRFAWAIKRALQYRDVVPLDLGSSIKYWADLEKAQIAAAEKASDADKPQQQALLKETKRNLELLQGLLLPLANPEVMAVLGEGGLQSVPRYLALKEMWQAGISFADLSCTNYFDLASRQQTARDFMAKEVQLLAGLTSAVQGVTGVSAKIISATASSFSFGQSAMNTYESTMALAPDIYLLQKAVQSKKRNLRSELDKPKLFAGSYYDVEQALLTYAEPCTFSGLKSIINEALQEKTK